MVDKAIIRSGTPSAQVQEARGKYDGINIPEPLCSIRFQSYDQALDGSFPNTPVKKGDSIEDLLSNYSKSGHHDSDKTTRQLKECFWSLFPKIVLYEGEMKPDLPKGDKIFEHYGIFHFARVVGLLLAMYEPDEDWKQRLQDFVDWFNEQLKVSTRSNH